MKKVKDLSPLTTPISIKAKDFIIFNNDPTPKDVLKAEKENNVIVCRLQGTVEEKVKEANRIRAKGIVDTMHLRYEASYIDEDKFSQEDFEKHYLSGIDSQERILLLDLKGGI